MIVACKRLYRAQDILGYCSVCQSVLCSNADEREKSVLVLPHRAFMKTCTQIMLRLGQNAFTYDETQSRDRQTRKESRMSQLAG